MSHDMGRSVFANRSKLTIADLPPPNTMRWVPRLKVAVVAAVESGLLSFEEASAHYSLSHEEFRSWRMLTDHYGFRKQKSRRNVVLGNADRLELHVY